MNGSKLEKEKMKKRRMRDLNNIASQKCRAKKRMLMIQEEEQCQELEKENTLLKQNIQNIEKEIQKLSTLQRVWRNSEKLSSKSINKNSMKTHEMSELL